MDDKIIFEQAARWHLLMQGSPSSSERAAFDAWLLDSRRHVRNFLLVSAMDCELARFDPEKRVAAQAAAAGTADHNIVTIGNTSRAKRPELSFHHRRTRVWWGAAAVALLTATLLLRPWDWIHRYSTATGEQRIVKLSDGSVIHLNTQSQARVNYSDGARDIELTHGEALFVVTRDPRRPFRVRVGSTTVQAVGTQFNVYRRATVTTVAVLEGRVQVFEAEGADKAHPALPLNVGEEVKVERGGRVIKHRTADINNTVAWRERRLVFREDTLKEIAAEFNRYNAAPRFRVEGANTEGRRYSGIFDAYDPESLALVLSADIGLSVEKAGDEIVIRKSSALARQSGHQ